MSNLTKLFKIKELEVLDPPPEEWSLKVIILRKGVCEPYQNSFGGGEKLKLIFLDEEVI